MCCWLICLGGIWPTWTQHMHVHHSQYIARASHSPPSSKQKRKREREREIASAESERRFMFARHLPLLLLLLWLCLTKAKSNYRITATTMTVLSLCVRSDAMYTVCALCVGSDCMCVCTFVSMAVYTYWYTITYRVYERSLTHTDVHAYTHKRENSNNVIWRVDE